MTEPLNQWVKNTFSKHFILAIFYIKIFSKHINFKYFYSIHNCVQYFKTEEKTKQDMNNLAKNI